MLLDVLRMLRPKQWSKNVLVLAPLFFAGEALSRSLFLNALAAAALFTVVSSSIYVFNDIIDRDKDRLHPKKRFRPLASGRLHSRSALLILFGLLCLALSGFFLLGNIRVILFLSAYLVMNIAYSVWLKHIVILDVLCVSFGFLLRILVGGAATGIYISEWLLLCTITLSLFLVFAKRRHELTLFEDHADRHRQVLSQYSTSFLDQVMPVVTTTALICYLFYVTAPRTIDFFGTRNMLFTVPFVLYGIFRYLYLVYFRNYGGDPVELVFADRPLLLAIIGWIGTCAVVIYG